MVFCVSNVDVTIGCHRDTIRILELPVARSIRAQFVSEHACGGELLDSVVYYLRDINTTVGCNKDSVRSLELPVARAIRSPFANENSSDCFNWSTSSPRRLLGVITCK